MFHLRPESLTETLEGNRLQLTQNILPFLRSQIV